MKEMEKNHENKINRELMQGIERERGKRWEWMKRRERQKMII